MRLPSRPVPSALLGAAALAFAFVFVLFESARTRADEPEQAQEKKTVETIVIGQDGEVRLVPAGKDGPPAEMHVLVRRSDDDGRVTRRVLELRDGVWVAVDDDADALAEGAERRAPASPLHSVLRWLLGEGRGERPAHDPLRAWFDGGPDVPLAGLRDALKADGWTAPRLRAWLGRSLADALAETSAPPARGSWFDVVRRPARCACRGERTCDCECHRPRCPRCGCPLPDSPRDAGRWGAGAGRRLGALPWLPDGARVRGRAYVIFDDGHGWQRLEIEPPGAHEEDRTLEPEVERLLRALLGETDDAAARKRSERIVVEGLGLLPPELRKELRELGLGDLLGDEGRGDGDGDRCKRSGEDDCEDCPKRNPDAK